MTGKKNKDLQKMHTLFSSSSKNSTSKEAMLDLGLLSMLKIDLLSCLRIALKLSVRRRAVKVAAAVENR
jgi:hypothetical protein